jgi:hypothetical protein
MMFVSPPDMIVAVFAALMCVPFMPWMQIAGVWLRRAGFTPGQRMHIDFDCRSASLIITPGCG